MSKLGWLILGLLIVLWAHPSHAVSMSQCADGAHWYPTSLGASVCPPVVSISGTSPSTTSVTVTGETTVATGTVYVSIRLNCTQLQWRQVVNGLGDEASATDSDVSSGSLSVNATGLAEGTAYCAHIVQYTADGRPSNNARIEFTTTETSGPAAGNEITGGDDLFYDSAGGSDANSGLTHALRKQNYPTDTSSLPTSTDVWLLTGSLWTNRPMDWNHAGTSGNYAELGTYYMDGSTPRKARDDVKGVGTTDTKAEIRGGLTVSCLTAGTCTFPETPPSGDGMNSMWDALVTVGASADYTSILNIKLNLSRYACLNASGLGHTSPGSLHNVIADGVDCANTGFGNIQYTDGIQDMVVRNSTIDEGNVCEVLRLKGASSNTSACSSAGWPNGIVAVRSPAARVLFEDNVVTHNFGEGLMCSFIIEFCVIRDNIVSNNWSDGVGTDSSRNNVVEGNIFLGKQGAVSSYYSGLDTSEGISGMMLNGAETSTQYGQTGNVYRNNLSASTNACFYMRHFSGVTLDIGAKFYGNTCVSSASSGTYPSTVIQATEELTTSEMDELDVKNNVIWFPNRDAAGVCAVTTDTENVFLDNHWSFNPSDSDCDGSGDTYGDPGLTLSTITDWDAFDYDTWPTWANANPAGGSALIGTGTALTSAILNKDDYGFAYLQIAEVRDGTLTEAEWECALCVDAEGTTRASPPSKGAVE